MSFMSQLSWMMRDYAEDRNGKINWFPNGWKPALTKGREVLRGGTLPFPECVHETTGEVFKLFPGKHAKCANVDQFDSLPLRAHEARRPYRLVPAKDCKACQFHEPAKRYGRKRYASCRWFRENSNMKSPAEMIGDSFKKAAEMLS